VAGLAARLRLSGAERARLQALTAVEMLVSDTFASHPQGAEPGRLRAWLAGRGRAAALDELWLAEARDGRERSPLRATVAAMEVPVFPLQGRDLLALGLAPGPAVGELLHALRDWWLAAGTEADRAACLAEARRRLEDAGAAYGPATPADPKAV
jgi:poly(A) polymerase/tRNA nucleotidyltransferase (CCA-adding enzyme)